MKLTDDATKKRIFTVLLATMFTVPYRAEAAEERKTAPGEAPGTAKVREAVQQEVIQLLTDEKDPESVIFNIAGNARVHFKVYYSPTGAEGSYRQLPGAAGVIDENGMARLSINVKKLELPLVYLKVYTSDTADFSKTRVTPKPLVIEWSDTNIKARGFIDKGKKPGVHFYEDTPAVAGVRG
ncbi:MAG TPA: hypothetical protein VI298_05905 [Geobacteraceae bacterium]